MSASATKHAFKHYFSSVSVLTGHVLEFNHIFLGNTVWTNGKLSCSWGQIWEQIQGNRPPKFIFIRA